MPRQEYAVAKNVRNHRVVREVDRRRHRELWKSVLLGGLLVLLVLFSAWQHFELLRHGYRLEPLQQQREQEQEMMRQLRLDIETLSAPQRIERLALERLELVAPEAEDIVVIERGTASELPDQSVVAARAVPGR